MENKVREVKMRKIVFALGAAFMLICTAAASEIDILTQKLLEKGVLTGGEGAQILSETNDEITKNLALGESNSVPKWVQYLNLKGDIRYRIQIDKTLSATAADMRVRERLRLRLNGTADLGSGFKLGLGFCSGTDDPRSTNQTLENSFEHPDLRIDLGWGEYSPVEGLTLLAGKFPYGSFLFKPSDLLFDTDLNFEGVAADYKAPVLGDFLGVFASIGYLNIDENSASLADPGLISAQVGVKANPGSGVYVKASIAMHMFENVQGMASSVLPATGGAGASNTMITSTSTTYTTVTTLTNTTSIGRIKTDTVTKKYKFDYDCLNAGVEVGLTDMYFPLIKVFGEVVMNRAVDAALLSDMKNGYILGLSFGDAKVDEFGKCQTMISHRMLQQDAWVDFFADSDAYAGKTASLVNELKITFGFSKSANLEFDYYIGRAFPAQTGGTDTQVVQFDFNFKF